MWSKIIFSQRFFGYFVHFINSMPSWHDFPRKKVRIPITYPFFSALGGLVIEKQCFDPKCTHIVVGHPLRNEKYLASVAAGKWVLHRSYLEASRTAGHFVSVCIHISAKNHFSLNVNFLTNDSRTSTDHSYHWNDQIWHIRLYKFYKAHIPKTNMYRDHKPRFLVISILIWMWAFLIGTTLENFKIVSL